MQNFICLVYLMRILLHLSTYFPNTPRICMGTQSQPLLIRTAWWMFMKLGKDEVLMAPYMHYDVSAISAQGRIQGRAKIGHGCSHLKKNCFLAQKATATNRMHSNDLEACGMKLCCFWFHSDVKFLTRSLYSGERQWPTWASCFGVIFSVNSIFCCAIDLISINNHV